MKKQRKYDKEFKMSAVKYYESSGKSIKETAKALGVPRSTFDGWIQEYTIHAEKSFPGSGTIKPANEDYYRLKKELEDVKTERGILKKAGAIFSRAKR